MPEDFHNGPGGDALGEQERGRRVPDVVEPQTGGRARPPSDAPEVPVDDVGGAERAPLHGAEHESAVLPPGAGRHAFLDLAGAVRAERPDDGLGHDEYATALRRLRRHELEALAGDALERVVHPERAGVEVVGIIPLTAVDCKLASPSRRVIEEDDGVPWTVPEFSRTEVNRAGEVLVAPRREMAELEHALQVINNWRSSHSFPLNTLQMALRDKASDVEARPLIAQRIKRLSSIEAKLRRFSSMGLARMQDIGGCRAVVASIPKVDALVDLFKRTGMRHALKREDDYIRNPAASGYRGYHLVYAYESDRNETYNGLRIEIQLRSQLQHAWATAVETVGTFLRQSLKASQGEAEWLRFFALMGTALALRERTARVPNTPSKKKDLVPELREIVQRLNVEPRLTAYGAALQTETLEHPALKNAHFFLLKLDPQARTTTVTGFSKKEIASATHEYLKAERAIADRPGAEAVLVSVGSLRSLRRAYPNYFLDTRVFLDAVRRATAE